MILKNRKLRKAWKISNCVVFAAVILASGIPIKFTYAAPSTTYETEEESTLYIIKDTYLYKDSNGNEMLGVIKCGNMIESQGIENGMYKVSYDGITGYIRAEDVGTSFEEYVSYTEKNEDGGKLEGSVIEQEGISPTLPTSHYVDSFGNPENAAMSLYACNQDFTDDYMVVSDSSNISIAGYLINAAYQNGTPYLTVAYSTDGITKDVSVKIPSFETADEDVYNMSFTYKDGVLTFMEDGDFPQGFEIGFAMDNISIMQKGTLLETTTDEEGITWISTNNRTPVTVSEKKEDATLTEVKKYMKNNVSEDTEDVSKTSDKMKFWYIPVVIIIVIVALVIGIIGKRKVRRYKGNRIRRRRKKKC